MRIEDSDRIDRIKRLRKKSMQLPMQPGVYIMHNKSDGIIYIGKAKLLKNRVSQYFGSETNHTEKVRQMVAHVWDFEYIVCDSEFEALILECSLIKQHQPKYNVLLKDDKGYHYIKVTGGEWPTVKSALQRENDDAEYIGPYSSGWVVKQTVDETRKIFHLPDCNKTFHEKGGKVRPCLNYYIGACSAPCAGKISKQEYNATVKDAVDFIKGGAKLSIKALKDEMERAADALDFERAARLRDRIRAVEKIGDRQKVTFCTYKSEDVFAFAGTGRIAAEVFVFRNSRLCDRHQFILDGVDDSADFRSEFLKQFYEEHEIPPRIVIDSDCDDRELLEQLFSKRSGKHAEIVIPKIGEQKKLVDMCRNNASEYLSECTGRKGPQLRALDELAQMLKLSKPPRYIESYDISNTQGSENVAGMVVFLDGKPLKSAYKKFKIKSFVGQDDCRSMAEVAERRFTEYKNAENHEEGFGRLPDLILLDGGKTQLNAVTAVLKRLQIDVPVFGMVKDGKHKTNAIETGGGTIAIKSNRQAFTLVYTIQEEVHRFAIGYHRSRSQKSMLLSELTAINGVGPATAKRLLSELKTMNAVKTASLETLQSVKGISKPAAQNVFNYYRLEE